MLYASPALGDQDCSGILKKAHIGEIAPIEGSKSKGEEFLANNGFEQLVKHPRRKKDSEFKER